MTITPLYGGVAVSSTSTTDVTSAIGASLTGYLFDLRVANDDSAQSVNYSIWILDSGGTNQRPLAGKCGGSTSPLPCGATDVLTGNAPIILGTGEKIQIKADAANRVRVTYSGVTR